MKKYSRLANMATITLLTQLNLQFFAGGKFDSKSFNPQAFGAYVERIPSTKRNELIKSRALKGSQQVRDAFSSQTGTAYAILPMTGRIGGDAQNYDGVTDIEAQTTTTFERGVVVYGRSNAWTESDFSTDITGGVDFMDNVAAQVNEYWDEVDQGVLLSILKGIFSMTGNENLVFVNNHTHNIAAVGEGVVNATALNTAIQRAAGDNKAKFTLTILHSAVATNLENLNVLEYLKYTDANGIQRSLQIGTWNGRIVLVDDSMPTEEVAATYVKTTDVALNAAKTYFTKSGSNYTAVATPDVANIANYYEKTADAYTAYTSYVLGDGAFDFEDIGAKVPFAMSRDEAKNGGQDTLYSRQRKVLAPYGISYKKAVQATPSPTNAELENGANWELVNDAAGETIDHKAIPIARIISRG